jgi:hypothetical protein
MDSVFKKLFTPDGIKLSTPSFNGYDPVYGGITTYPPGVKENGGIFVHPNPWAESLKHCLEMAIVPISIIAPPIRFSRNDCIEVLNVSHMYIHKTSSAMNIRKPGWLVIPG